MKTLLYILMTILAAAATSASEISEVAVLQAKIKDGDLDAMCTLGSFFMAGDGVPMDKDEGFRYYLRAARLGNVRAQNVIGLCFAKGIGIKRSINEAIFWFHSAAVTGHKEAQFNMATALLESRGDLVDAMKWTSLAARSGHKPAEQLRSLLENVLLHSELQEAKEKIAAFVSQPVASVTPKSNLHKAGINTEYLRSGSGFFVSSSGHLITTFDVVQQYTRLVVRTADAKVHDAVLLKAEGTHNLALLKIQTNKVTYLRLGESTAMKLGHGVLTVGYPNIQLQGLAPKMSRGEINSLTGLQDNPHTFQISAPIQKGSYGGALLNMTGEVIGMISSSLTELTSEFDSRSLSQNVNYATKSEFFPMLLKELPEFQKAPAKTQTQKDLTVEAIIDHAEKATALVLAY